jgi:hypothetical protein
VEAWGREEADGACLHVEVDWPPEDLVKEEDSHQQGIEFSDIFILGKT